MNEDTTILYLPPHQLEMLQDVLRRVQPKGYNEKQFVGSILAMKPGDRSSCVLMSIVRS